MFSFWWSAKQSELKTLTEMQKKWKKPSKSLKNEMFIFGLHSTPDDWPSDPSKKHRPKHNKQKRLPKTSKNKMFIFFITFNFWWSAEWSKQKTSTKIQKNGKGPLRHWKMKCSFFDYVQLLMIGWAIWAKMLSEMQKNEKGPLSHQKIKCSFLDYINFWWSAEQSEQKTLTETQKNEKSPLSHRKMKCSFFNYVQLLMIGRAIRA